MAPYARWVVPSFRTILVDNCDDFLASSDRGTDKTRTKLITQVSKDITVIAQEQGETLPNDLEKCVRTWFGNYASGNTKEARPPKSKSDTRGHPTSSKSWTAKSVCGHRFAERISAEQMKLSDGGEKDIGKYRPALANIFEQLSEAELKQCEDLAVEWNTKPLPDEVQRKLSKNVPTDVTDFLKFMNDRTGAVFIAFAAYTNEDGEQIYARYETEDLKFFATRQEHRKGPNNIVDMWKEFNLEAAEEEDSHEALEFDDEEYPQLPDNVGEFRLHRRRAILRQYMAAARRFYKLNGRIPWTDIAENPSHHLSRKSRPDSDHRLEEPSHMKSDGIDAWLRHWLKLQKKHRRPLVVKNPADKSSEPRPKLAILSKRKAKRAKARYIESDSTDDTADRDITDKSDDESQAVKKVTGAVNAKVLPPPPLSASATRKSRRAFLATLSSDKNYKLLQRLLYAAKDGDLLEESPPAWVAWESNDNYLPAAFYKAKSTASLSTFTRWVMKDPITADGDALASYKQVELVILGFGLAFRALWIAQFPEIYSDVPAYILNSPYPFSEYEQLSHKIENIISGYDETLQELEAAYPTPQPKGKASTSQGTSNDVVGEKAKTRSDRRQPGLGGVPASLQHLREEVGLSGARWESLGAEWQALAALWLRAETALFKAGRTDLSFTEIQKASIPDEWKEWMNAKLLKTDAKRPAESFGQVFTNYLNGLPSTVMDIGGTVMTEIWCRQGRTGILGLLLCLYWQAEYSGGGKSWKANMKRVEGIFNAILAIPELQRAKRGRAASGESDPSKPTLQGRDLGKMTFPNPLEAPDDFAEHLKSLNLDLLLTIFSFCRTRPVKDPNVRYDEDSAMEWCERMDSLLGKLHRAMGTQPKHEELFVALNVLCANAIANCEMELEDQRMSDRAEMRRLEEEERRREEAARLAAEKEKKEKLERSKKMEIDRQEIEAAERELEAKKEALRIAQKGPDDDDEEEDEEGGESNADERVETNKKKTKRELEEEARKKAPQTTHSSLCISCVKANESTCMGPTGQACNVCWKLKKSCSNGGRRRPTVKEEPRSPAQAKKRKANSVSDASSIGRADATGFDIEAAEPNGKRQKIASGGSSQVRFDGIMVPPVKAPRRSTRSAKANSKKDINELFERLGQEFGAVAKTCKDIAETIE